MAKSGRGKGRGKSSKPAGKAKSPAPADPKQPKAAPRVVFAKSLAGGDLRVGTVREGETSVIIPVEGREIHESAIGADIFEKVLAHKFVSTEPI